MASKTTSHFIAEINEEVENTVDQALELAEKGEIEKGASMLSSLRNDHPRNHLIYYGLGVVCALREQLDEAIEYFDKAIDIFPYFMEAHFNKAVAYKEKLDIANTIAAFKKVILIGDPEDKFVKQAQSFIEAMERRVRETAGIDLEIYLEAGRKFNEASVCMKKQEWQKAIDKFQECLAKNKNNVQSHGNIGLCYAYLGQKEKALDFLNKALEIDPSYEPAVINRLAVESLKDGEKLKQKEFESVEYYRDYPLRKKSLLQSIFSENGFFRGKIGGQF
ncbi:MAG: tetratricopeptide repeat protein [Planctomycetota bacterium]|nr:tetratricopeptide repeat protein [Planctomycetota bacterium]MDI6786881.1 tetratricopeptide repeat protein [Planctomycetota bacterium]